MRRISAGAVFKYLPAASPAHFYQPRFNSSTVEAAMKPAVSPTSSSLPPPSQRLVPGPYRKVGNIIVVRCIDHPFKHYWEVNKELRDLRIEFKGQTTIVPDTPIVRKKLWRVRHVVKIDVMDLDEVREIIGVPTHVTFAELKAQIPRNFGRVRGFRSPFSRSRYNFHALRSQRLRDILERDQIEKRLLEKKKQLKASKASSSQVAAGVR